MIVGIIVICLLGAGYVFCIASELEQLNCRVKKLEKHIEESKSKKVL